MNDRMTPFAAAILATLYPASAALAQRTASDGAKLEEVIVTATRREVNLQDVAQSVTALSTEDIAKQAFQSLDDVVGALPSVTLVNACRAATTSSCAASPPAPASTTRTARSRSTWTISR